VLGVRPAIAATAASACGQQGTTDGCAVAAARGLTGAAAQAADVAAADSILCGADRKGVS